MNQQNPINAVGATNGSQPILMPVQSGGSNFTNGFTNGHSQSFNSSGFQPRMNTQYQPRFQQQQQQQSSNIAGNFVPRKIGQVGGVDVLSSRPAEPRNHMGIFPDPTNQSNLNSNFFHKEL